MTKKYEGEIEVGDEVVIRGVVEEFVDIERIKIRLEVGVDRDVRLYIDTTHISELIKQPLKVGDIVAEEHYTGKPQSEIIAIRNNMAWMFCATYNTYWQSKLSSLKRIKNA